MKDIDGEGNGCDGVLELLTSVHCFQVKTVARKLGPTQKRGVIASLSLAAQKVPIERKKPVRRMTFFFNIDMAPSEAAWFSKLKARSGGIDLDYHGLNWIVDRLLLEPNSDLRREYIEFEFDRQDRIIELLEEVRDGQASDENSLGRLGSELARQIRLIRGDKRAMDALVTIVERAQHHYTRALRHIDQSYFERAVASLDEALAVLVRHKDEPLYPDLLYWRGIALQGANRWSEALEAFDLSRSEYGRSGRLDEEAYAAGNRGHALFRLNRMVEALKVFQREQEYWAARNDLDNLTRGYLNLAMVFVANSDDVSALRALEEGKETLQRLAPDPQRFISHYKIACGLSGNAAAVHCRLGNYSAALGTLDVSIQLAEMVKDDHLAAMLRVQSADPLRELGLLEESDERLRSAKATFEARGDRLHLTVVLNGQAFNCLWRGEKEAAIRLLEEDAALCKEIGDERGLEKTVGLLESLRRR